MELINDFLAPLPPPSKPAGEWTLGETCVFAGRFWSAVYSGIGGTILRDLGYEQDSERAVRFMKMHGDGHFMDGCRKLGIDQEPSHPILCAKYHAISNALGGLRLKYAIESPQKAWLFYYPNTFDVGTALNRDDRMLSTFSGWHRHNSTRLGNPGLVFVVTHLLSRGDPYDAGYFLDTGEDVPLEDRLRISFDEEPPGEDERRLPEVDPAEWPEERRMRSSRNVRVGWATDAAFQTIEAFGEPGAACVRHGLETALYAWLAPLEAAFGAGKERGGGAYVAGIFASVHAISGTGWSADVETVDGATRVQLSRGLLTASAERLDGEKRALGDRALLDAWSGLARQLGARVSLEGDGDAERTWIFTDRG